MLNLWLVLPMHWNSLTHILLLQDGPDDPDSPSKVTNTTDEIEEYSEREKDYEEDQVRAMVYPLYDLG